jgi:magnesium-transporting ATPase (P-type)
MEFRHCSINGTRYDMKEDKQLYIVDDEKGLNDLIVPENSPDITRFLVVLALCHTVQLMPHRRPSFDASAGFSFSKQKLTAKMKAASSLFTLDAEQDHVQLPGLGNMEYQASSPDEKALLEACCQ